MSTETQALAGALNAIQADFVHHGRPIPADTIRRAVQCIKTMERELDRRANAVALMRPVIEAAEEWYDEDDYLESVSDWLASAVDTYRASVAALDAGEPAGE